MAFLLQKTMEEFWEVNICQVTFLIRSKVKSQSQWTRVNLNSNRTDTLYRPYSDAPASSAPYQLCQPGFNFYGTTRLFTVPGLSYDFFTYPTGLVQCGVCHYELGIYLSLKQGSLQITLQSLPIFPMQYKMFSLFPGI